MTLIGEAGAGGDGTESERFIRQQRPRAVHLNPPIVPVDRDAVRRAEHARHDARIAPDECRGFGQRRARRIDDVE
jgi:hypothetical protein